MDVLEADLIVLMSALCRLAARRQAGTDADLYVKAGKKLASDILMKVLQLPPPHVSVYAVFCRCTARTVVMWCPSGVHLGYLQSTLWSMWLAELS